MSYFPRHNGSLMAEGMPLSSLAEQYGTPLYVYSRSAIESAYQEFSDALADHKHLICYAVKANSNLSVINLLARLGSGFDIVSSGELKRVLAAGATADRIVFSGVGKTHDEIREALTVGIRCFNIESAAELERLAKIAAEAGVVAPVSLRINPDVDAGTHPYISTGLKENKFGIGTEDAIAVYERAAELSSIDIQGIDCHIGSQLTDIEPYRDAYRKVIEVVDTLASKGIRISHFDVGGGQGIQYDNPDSLSIPDWAAVVVEAIGDRDIEILVEPGRYIAGPAGVLLTRVEYLKTNEDRHFAIVDAAMNDLIRPALYSAWQAIEAVETRDIPQTTYDVVGPVCESADFLGKSRALAIDEGDLLAVRQSGAYAFVMSSNYNTRARAAEIMVDGEQAHVVRQRETIEELFASEAVLPD